MDCAKGTQVPSHHSCLFQEEVVSIARTKKHNIFHDEQQTQSHLLVVGFYNGAIAIYDVRERSSKPALSATHSAGKHSEPVKSQIYIYIYTLTYLHTYSKLLKSENHHAHHACCMLRTRPLRGLRRAKKTTKTNWCLEV